MADIVARVKALLMEPAREWPAIAAEPADTKSLILGYAAILSLIPAVVGLLTVWLLVGLMPMHFGFGSMLLHTIVRYIIGLGAIWVVGKIIQTLAPMFDGSNDEVSAMKLSVYAPTASWVASIFLLIPLVGFIVALVGLGYSIYLFYLGAPVIVRIPAAKAAPFTAAVAVSAIVLFIAIGWLTGRIIPSF